MTNVHTLAATLARTVNEYGACGTRPDPMTGNKSLAKVVDPPPLPLRDEDGGRPVFMQPASARYRHASSTSSAVRVCVCVCVCDAQ